MAVIQAKKIKNATYKPPMAMSMWRAAVLAVCMAAGAADAFVPVSSSPCGVTGLQRKSHRALCVSMKGEDDAKTDRRSLLLRGMRTPSFSPALVSAAATFTIFVYDIHIAQSCCGVLCVLVESEMR
jgi:hypothetical protein